MVTVGHHSRNKQLIQPSVVYLLLHISFMWRIANMYLQLSVFSVLSQNRSYSAEFLFRLTLSTTSWANSANISVADFGYPKLWSMQRGQDLLESRAWFLTLKYWLHLNYKAKSPSYVLSMLEIVSGLRIISLQCELVTYQNYNWNPDSRDLFPGRKWLDGWTQWH